MSSQPPLDYATPRHEPPRQRDWPRLALRWLAATIVVAAALVFVIYGWAGAFRLLSGSYRSELPMKYLTLAMIAAVPMTLAGILYVLCERPRA